MAHSRPRKVYFIVDDCDDEKEESSLSSVEDPSARGDDVANVAAAASSPSAGTSGEGSSASEPRKDGTLSTEDSKTPTSAGGGGCNRHGQKKRQSTTTVSGFKQTQIVIDENATVQEALDLLNRKGLQILREKFGVARVEVIGVVSMEDRGRRDKYFECCLDMPVKDSLSNDDLLVVRDVGPPASVARGGGENIKFEGIEDDSEFEGESGDSESEGRGEDSKRPAIESNAGFARQQEMAERQGSGAPLRRSSISEESQPRKKRQRGPNVPFEERLKQLRRYKELHGDCNVPRTWEDDEKLGQFVVNTRHAYRRFKEGKYSSMNDDKIKNLEDMGFEWGRTSNRDNSGTARKVNKPAYKEKKSLVIRGRKPTWSERMAQLQDYRITVGDINVPVTFEQYNNLGRFVAYQRICYKKLQRGESSSLTWSEAKELGALGFNWRCRREKRCWSERLEQLRSYKAEHGNLDVPFDYAERDNLGNFVAVQRRNYRAYREGEPQPRITRERIIELDALGFQWKYD